jgi:hypothetical protein
MTEKEARRTVSIHREANGAAAEHLLQALVISNRATQLRLAQETFWIAVERLPLLQTIYPQGRFEPKLSAPESIQRQEWEQAEAIRELLRGRLEVSVPVTTSDLADVLSLSRSEIDAVLQTLEAEGFVLRGKFRTHATNRNGDRRLHEFTDSLSTGCARKFSRFRFRISIVSFSLGTAQIENTASKVRKDCSRFWSNLMAASCRWLPGNRPFLAHALPNTTQNGSTAFASQVASAGDG